jgi:hypothetical protein
MMGRSLHFEQFRTDSDLGGIFRIGLLRRTAWGHVSFEIDDINSTVFDGN